MSQSGAVRSDSLGSAESRPGCPIRSIIRAGSISRLRLPCGSTYMILRLVELISCYNREIPVQASDKTSDEEMGTNIMTWQLLKQEAQSRVARPFHLNLHSCLLSSSNSLRDLDWTNKVSVRRDGFALLHQINNNSSHNHQDLLI
eukprot:754764-Hanusia_phi.AAC.1